MGLLKFVSPIPQQQMLQRPDAFPQMEMTQAMPSGPKPQFSFGQRMTMFDPDISTPERLMIAGAGIQGMFNGRGGQDAMAVRGQIDQRRQQGLQNDWMAEQQGQQRRVWQQQAEARQAWVQAVRAERDLQRRSILQAIGPEGYAKLMAEQMSQKQVSLPEGMRIGASGQPEWIPDYVEGRSRIARAGIPPMPAPPPGFEINSGGQ